VGGQGITGSRDLIMIDTTHGPDGKSSTTREYLPPEGRVCEGHVDEYLQLRWSSRLHS